MIVFGSDHTPGCSVAGHSVQWSLPAWSVLPEQFRSVFSPDQLWDFCGYFIWGAATLSWGLTGLGTRVTSCQEVSPTTVGYQEPQSPRDFPGAV